MFNELIFFKSIFSRKNWRGGGELLLKNGTIHGYADKPSYCPGRIYIALARWRFSQHLPAKERGIPKKKSYNLSARPLALCHVVNPVLVIALRS